MKELHNVFVIFNKSKNEYEHGVFMTATAAKASLTHKFKRWKRWNKSYQDKCESEYEVHEMNLNLQDKHEYKRK